jgi:hypothetical protein
MKKTFLFFLTVLSYAVQAQADFYAKTNRTEISENERLRVDFVMNRNEEDFIPPAFKDFYVVMGPSVSQSYTWINGKSSFTKTYTYILQPKRKGVLTVEPATAVFDGKEYTTEPLKIRVTESAESPVLKGNDTRGQAENKVTANGKDLFFTAEPTKTGPYVGEPFGILFKLYIKKDVEVADLNFLKNPEFEGFWSERLSNKIEGPFEKIIDGVPYKVYVVEKYMLVPQQSGTLKIKPMKLELVKMEYEERIFGFFKEWVQVPHKLQLTSGTKIVRVKPLPATGKPDYFSGAIGRYDLDLIMENDTVRAGEPVTLHIKISGEGNLGLIELPEIHLPQDIEVYEPEIKNNVRKTLSGYKGSVEKVYTLIPQKSGKYIIPSVRFAYFDPRTEKYVELKTGEKILNVYGSVSQSTAAIPSAKPANTLLPLAGNARWQRMDVKPFFGSKVFYLLHYLAVLLLILAVAGKFIQKKIKENPAFITKKKTEKLFSGLFDKAAGKTHDKEEFYGTLEQILNEFFKRKLGLKPVELTKENIEKRLRQSGVEPETIDELKAFWQKIQGVRYSPLDVPDMSSDLERLKKLIRHLEKRLK